MDVFRLALSQHAVKRDFEYNTEKSTQRRLRAYCKRRDEDECPWRIHASTTADRRTVKKNPFDHDCSSTKRKKKVKNATKFWICEKVKDWLIEDATLGAMELWQKLKQHYKIKIHYKRVYMGRFKGQLASATAVDGHNWMYPVFFGVFDSETNENWIWFMQLLRQAIGSPTGLAICTDAGQAVMIGVKEVFPEAEHRECMFHLVSNFKKKFTGKVFDDHLWAAAYSWNPYIFDKNWATMVAVKPAATAYIRKWHNRLWSRSQFSTICKVDYVTNNLAECFNNWIKHYKSLNLDDFLDKARQLIMILWNDRRKVAKKLDGLILPHIMKKLNAMTRAFNLEVVECSEEVAEVVALGGSSFRASYSNLIPAMPDKSQWPESDHGFFMHPPLLKATAGRPKTERYKGCSDKKRKKGKHLCPICKDYGHHWHNCKKGNPDDIAAMLAIREPPKKRAKTSKTALSIVPYEDGAPTRMLFPPPSQSLETTTKKKREHDNTESGGSKRSKTGSIKKAKTKKKVAEKIPVPLDNPAMGTRSRKFNPPNPAISTRSKRRPSL
ncbi:hypothetical protein ACQ4PT_039610 [Festuca glaucescens]